MSSQKSILVLEDGEVFEGAAFGAPGEAFGEVVFNTSMTGYQEIMTDPSYYGQMVCMTYPLIGNYGINDLDIESARPQVSGFIVREVSGVTSNWRSNESLSNYLARHNIPGIEGIDTRKLVLHIREKGAMRGGISSLETNPEKLLKKVLDFPKMAGTDYVKDVTTHSVHPYSSRLEHKPEQKPLLKIAAYDFGMKHNICELMVEEGMDVTVVPADTRAEDVLAMNPDGVFLSNGPGDPAALDYIIRETKQLIGKKPLFGICLGHQILGLALGGKTYKLKFGHRGANHPVKDLKTGKIEITVQNHGFCVDPDSLPEEAEITHWNLNDQTVEGLKHKELPIFCVQYHPEASPGPSDACHLFSRFRKMILVNSQ